MVDPVETQARIEAVEKLAADSIDVIAAMGAASDRTAEAFIAILKIHARRLIELESQLLVLTLRLNSRT